MLHFYALHYFLKHTTKSGNLRQTTEVIQSEEENKRVKNKSEQSIKNLGNTIEKSNICVIGDAEGDLQKLIL